MLYVTTDTATTKKLIIVTSGMILKSIQTGTDLTRCVYGVTANLSWITAARDGINPQKEQLLFVSGENAGSPFIANVDVETFKVISTYPMAQPVVSLLELNKVLTFVFVARSILVRSLFCQ